MSFDNIAKLCDRLVNCKQKINLSFWLWWQSLERLSPPSKPPPFHSLRTKILKFPFLSSSFSLLKFFWNYFMQTFTWSYVLYILTSVWVLHTLNSNQNLISRFSHIFARFWCNNEEKWSKKGDFNKRLIFATKPYLVKTAPWTHDKTCLLLL